MIDRDLFEAFLDSMKDPFLFADTGHIIRYMNRAAEAHYRDRGGRSLIGTSLLACHPEESRKLILEIFGEMTRGVEERLITDNQTHRIYMRAVRDPQGRLLGYYERYEPPAG